MKLGITLAVSLAAFAIRPGNAALRYVDLNSTNPAPPFASWSTAAQRIQDAVDVADSGDTVLVANGQYRTGGQVVSGVTNEYNGPGLPGTALTIPGATTNRVAITKAIRVESVNGFERAAIEGSSDATNPVRCAYLTNGAVLSGFTLTNGLAETGGGIWALSTYALVSNCIIVSNQAAQGGGVFSATLENCRVLNNRAIYAGGGALASTLRQCALIGNFAGGGGGGTGGGAAYCSLNNCTIVKNFASADGGGVMESILRNCIVHYNARTVVSSFYDNHYLSFLDFCCTTPLPTNGTANFSSSPGLSDIDANDLHLAADSPCINAGNNAFVAGSADLDGNPRIVGGTVDIGAYEFQTPASTISYAWLQSYGLTEDGSADHLDSDGDGADNWQEWRAGTVPTNVASVLRMLPPTGNDSAVTVSWQSVTNRTYYLQSATNLAAQLGFTTLHSNIQGQADITSLLDTNSAGSVLRFYRVGVQ